MLVRRRETDARERGGQRRAVGSGARAMTSTATVTAMFTDLVDSTAISSRLGPDAAEELRQTHFGLLRSSVAASDGSEVKTTGDGLMVVFPSVTAALECAVRIQQAVELHNRHAVDDALEIRIGISHGEAERTEDDDYFGSTVVEAARLCAAANGGQILATEVVRVLAGERGGHMFSPLGSLELKGLQEPVSTVEVGWSPATADQLAGTPLPARLDVTPPLGLVGRDDELSLLRQSLKDAQAGERRVVLVGGEIGIGKTTLMARLATDARESGATVLYGRCDEGLGIPYQPWAEALRHLIEHAAPELLSDHLVTYGGAIARLVPELHRVAVDTPEPAGGDAEIQRYELFGSVVGLLQAVAARTPMVVVLDDLHWADKQSLLLLRHVASHTISDRLLIAGAYRDVELTETHGLSDALAALRRETGVERIALRGLQDIDTVALLESAAGDKLDDAGVGLAHALYRETDGNPFFTLEVLRHLVESGVLVQAADGRGSAATDLADVGLPESVREVIGQRVRRLGDPTHTVLSQAAVVGRDFDVELLAAVCERSEDELLDLLEPATKAGVVVEQANGFAFTHTLIQHSLYDALISARRRRIHLRIAQALEQLCVDDLGPRVGELARHWAAATAPVDTAKAIEYSHQAGVQALDALAPDDAVVWFTQALELLDQRGDADTRRRCDLLIGLGTAQRQNADPAHRETLLEAAALARELQDAERLAAAALANNPGRSTVTGAADSERIRSLEAAIDLVPERHGATRAELFSTLAVELSWSPDAEGRRRSLAEEAVAMARRVGDPATLVRVLGRAFHALYAPDTHDLRLGYAMEALDLTERIREPGLRGVALDRAMWALLDVGDLIRFDELLGEQRLLADRLGEPVLRWGATLLSATRTMITGTMDDCQLALDELPAVGDQTGTHESQTWWAALAGQLRIRRGQLADFLPLLEDIQAQLPGMPAVTAERAALYCELGRVQEARTLLNEAAKCDFRELPRDRAWLIALGLWADVAAGLAAGHAAAILYDALEPYGGQVLNPLYGMAEGPVSFHLGRLATALGRYDLAKQHFVSAESFCRSIQAQYWLARNQLAYAGMLEARDGTGDAERARQLLDEALSIAVRGGYEHLQRQARARRGVGST
jgi:class 3 adenylate cyclase/tetratricopeptide (TPR) repeat protein